MNQKYAILVRKLTREELEEVMREGFSFDEDCEITICSTSNPRTHILYLPETLKAWQFAESYLYLVTEEKAKNADIIGWMNTDDTIFGVQPGEHLALRMVNDEGSILPIFVNRYNTCYIENFIEEDFDEKKMTREEKAFFDEKEGTILHHTTKYTTTFVPCKLPETTYEEVISFSGDFNKNEDETGEDIETTPILKVFNDRFTPYLTRIFGERMGGILSTIIYIAVVFFGYVVGRQLYEDAMISFWPLTIAVILLTIVIDYFLAKRMKKRLESPKKFSTLLLTNSITALIFATILGGILLEVNSLISIEKISQKVEIVENHECPNTKRQTHHYEVDINMPIYPYSLTINTGEDSTFNVGTPAVLYYHKGCLGINYVDYLDHK